jgi:hypothetical protein
VPKFKVFHNDKFLDIPSFMWGEKVEPRLKDLVWVADVYCKNLDEAYRLTNHIDEPWWTNKEVKEYIRSRSTSCGDVIVDESGQGYLVVAVGFREYAY